MVVPKSMGTRLVATDVMEHPVLYHFDVGPILVANNNVVGMLHYTSNHQPCSLTLWQYMAFLLPWTIFVIALRSLWFRHDGVFSLFPRPLTASSKSRDPFGGVTRTPLWNMISLLSCSLAVILFSIDLCGSLCFLAKNERFRVWERRGRLRHSRYTLERRPHCHCGQSQV